MIDLGVLYPVLIYLVLAGTTSAVNLTDGLDGLAAGCAAIVLLAYIAITFTTGQLDLTLLAGCLVGACVGFLWFNSFPASIFMGDTGSLGLGGAIAAMAVMTKTEVLLIILGGIFVIEALSVLIQVFSFQVFRKRVFLMAPIHHHFELQAWSETKIILRFWIVAVGLRGDRLHALPAVGAMTERRRLVSSGSTYERDIGFSRAVRVGERVVRVGDGRDLAGRARGRRRRAAGRAVPGDHRARRWRRRARGWPTWCGRACSWSTPPTGRPWAPSTAACSATSGRRAGSSSSRASSTRAGGWRSRRTRSSGRSSPRLAARGGPGGGDRQLRH